MTLGNELPKIITKTVPGPKGQDIIDRRAVACAKAIGCSYPAVMAKAEGAMFQDPDGNVFLDWVGGVGVTNLGYSNPEVIKVIQEQSEKFCHAMFNIYSHEGYVKLAEKLNKIVPVKGDIRNTMFVCSGSEANENAVKIAKAYTGRPNIIVFSGAFHGRTNYTMAMTAKKGYAVGQGPFPDGVYRAEFPYLYRAPKKMTEAEAIDYYITRLENMFMEATPAEYCAAIVFEPVQGEGGFVPAPIEWVKAVRKICDEKGILLVADEVQTGFARSGRMFATEYWEEAGCPPDIVTMAKSIAQGIPISAVTARKEIFDKVPAGTIGGTYGGNALGCAAALKVIEIMEREDFPSKARHIGVKITERYNQWKEKYDVVGDVRGIGSMVGIEFVTDKATKTANPAIVKAIIHDAAQMGLILENAGNKGSVVRLLAPLCMTDEQTEAGLKIFEKAIIKNLDVK
ncbi:aspartate aminotransferase family protein [Clostridium drakei]|uniref:(S)-3-amino-2-methylpropionate transaminase n=1 Tax=Clostridium drakei TaxID=332101 RepID=A0A2U8DKI2_9CLOT|nr:aspartate aminotransferase family protein [Clostridium drakei]AWI03246.1 aspartate aminotransferase family protein [Clostridium drakei]